MTILCFFSYRKINKVFVNEIMSLPPPVPLPLDVEVEGTIEHVDGSGSFWFRPLEQGKWLEKTTEELSSQKLSPELR